MHPFEKSRFSHIFRDILDEVRFATQPLSNSIHFAISWVSEITETPEADTFNP